MGSKRKRLKEVNMENKTEVLVLIVEGVSRYITAVRCFKIHCRVHKKKKQGRINQGLGGKLQR
jgi:hypothetical protein